MSKTLMAMCENGVGSGPTVRTGTAAPTYTPPSRVSSSLIASTGRGVSTYTLSASLTRGVLAPIAPTSTRHPGTWHSSRQVSSLHCIVSSHIFTYIWKSTLTVIAHLLAADMYPAKLHWKSCSLYNMLSPPHTHTHTHTMQLFRCLLQCQCLNQSSAQL